MKSEPSKNCKSNDQSEQHIVRAQCSFCPHLSFKCLCDQWQQHARAPIKQEQLPFLTWARSNVNKVAEIVKKHTPLH